MDERLLIALCLVVGGGLGAFLGAAFGAMAGLQYAQSGGAAGTGFGRWVADTFARAGQREMTSTRRAVLIGAADGFVFLGVVGLLAGAVVAVFGRPDPRWLGLAALAVTLLVAAAAFFGTLAYSMTRYGARAIVCILGGGLAGSLIAGILFGADDCLYGTLPGLVAGLALSFAFRRYTPTFRPPGVDEPAPAHRSEASTDIFHKPDAFREE